MFSSINISSGQQQNAQVENINERKGRRFEMEQAKEEAQQQQKQPKSPMRCPRCNSLNTRFRYFNNYSPTQPRHHCRNCKRQWTVGGRLKLIPVGGNTRNGKLAKASSSGGGNSRSQSPHPPLSLEEQHQHNLTLMNAMASQNFDTALFHPITNMVAAVSPWNYFGDQISYLCATQTLIQQVTNQHIDARNLFSSAGTNMRIPQEWNVQTMAPQQDLSQQNPMTFESYQTHNEVINAPPSHLYIDKVVQPARPVNSLAQEITYDSSFTMSNACLLQKNVIGDAGEATGTEDTNYVDVDEWLNLPGSDPSGP